eukprot:11933847-Heterocapsa_arctica.AAC.1
MAMYGLGGRSLPLVIRDSKNIAIVDDGLISDVFYKIEVNTYHQLNDENEQYNIGFIADDVEHAIDGLGFDNLVHTSEEGMRSLAYDRK